MVPALNILSCIIADNSCFWTGKSHSPGEVILQPYSADVQSMQILVVLSICWVLIHISLEHIGQYGHHYATGTDDEYCGYDSGLLELKVHGRESLHQRWSLRKGSLPQWDWCCQTARAPSAARRGGIQAVGTREICIRWPSLCGATCNGIM